MGYRPVLNGLFSTGHRGEQPLSVGRPVLNRGPRQVLVAFYLAVGRTLHKIYLSNSAYTTVNGGFTVGRKGVGSEQ